MGEPLATKELTAIKMGKKRWRIECSICDTKEDGFKKKELQRAMYIHELFWHRGPVIIPMH